MSYEVLSIEKGLSYRAWAILASTDWVPNSSVYKYEIQNFFVKESVLNANRRLM